MTRDYTQFLPPRSSVAIQPPSLSPLAALGWQPFFARQTDLDTLERTPPCRVTEVHRSGLRAIGDGIEASLPPRHDVTVGDWVLYDADDPAESVVLERKSLLKRRAAGHDRRVQLIAANIDTVFIVTSCNADFNVARLERYIALALDAGIDPVILLTKADLCDAVEPYLEDASAISDLVPVLALDARGADPLDKLKPWCKPGRTIAFLGSSGVGKSTLTNALIGEAQIGTQAIREDDAKGRHTTTHRHLRFLPAGFAVLDTPGMREVQLTDVAAGVEDLFSDLQEIAATCRFRDCAHDTEPGCAVRDALDRGDIEAPRLERWRKLTLEEAANSASLAERRSRDKTFGKMIKKVQKANRKRV